MNEIVNVFVSWQFLLVGVIVFLLFAIFNGLGSWQGVGAYMWKIQSKGFRKFLKVMEGIKMIWPPLFGFALGWIPAVPRPEALEDTSQFTAALLYAVAGLCSPWIVKGVRKALEARGIDIELDEPPKAQKKM